MIGSYTNLLAYELKRRDVQSRFRMPEMLPERYKKVVFQFVTGEEKYLSYDNRKRKMSYLKSD